MRKKPSLRGGEADEAIHFLLDCFTSFAMMMGRDSLLPLTPPSPRQRGEGVDSV